MSKKFENGLVKACGVNSGMEVRDYIGFRLARDMKDHKKDLDGHLDARYGDHVMIISFKWRSAAHHARATARVRKLMKKHGIKSTTGK